VLLISDDLDELLELSGRIGVMTSGTLTSVTPARALNGHTLLAAISRSAEGARRSTRITG
jgi:ABC-type uncharacterized transport system ATPase subunit